MHRFGTGRIAAIAALLAGTPSLAFAQAAEIDRGDTAWLLTATALVLFMTLPGLALFYAGLVRLKHSLSVLMHCVAIVCVVSVLWFVFGYSLSFSEGNALIGDFSKALLSGVGRATAKGSVPETVFFMFQMTFAIITPALIVGAWVERLKFSAMLVFVVLWSLTVYAPVCHWVWGGGWLAQRGVMDYAGGLVVHTTAGVSALIIAAFVGRRDGYPHDLQPPHDPGMTMIGGGMLWVGWYGFNAGSALAANGDAGMAMTVTHLAAAAAGLTWAGLEAFRFGKPSLVGIVTGAVAGLATVTPTSGHIGPAGALLLGVVASVFCFAMVQFVRKKLKIDDALDVFAVHGAGGMLGSLLVAVLAAEEFGGTGYPVTGSMGAQAGVQFIGVLATAAWSGVATVVIIYITKALTGLRAKPEHLDDGLDLAEHGERAFSP
jgi:Amt family ammonium transporter